MRKELYDVTHSTPYQLINTGLYMAAPYTAGVTAIPAGAMTAAALAGDLAENGLSVQNAVNTGFDVVSALPALSWLRQNTSAVLMPPKESIRMLLARGVILSTRLILPNRVLRED